MEREQYAIMALREERHWWYAGMRRVALTVLGQALDGRRGLRILDAKSSAWTWPGKRWSRRAAAASMLLRAHL